MYREIKPEEIRTLTTGYLYFTDKDHPLAKGSGNMVHYHRHLMSLQLGRWLTREEHVHHIDHNRSNNEISNLLVLSASEHARLHRAKPREKTCTKCGVSFAAKASHAKFCSIECSISSRAPAKEILEKICTNCETSFTTKSPKAKFCSILCSNYSRKPLEKICAKCGVSFTSKFYEAKFCGYKCANLHSIKNQELSKEILEPKLWELGFTKAGQLFGYTDNGLRKRAKALGCIMPPPYFHNKVKDIETRLKEYNKRKLECLSKNE